MIEAGPMSLARELDPGRALIFRLTHRDNLPWILRNGLHARTSDSSRDPDFVAIGNSVSIQKRHVRTVPIPPGGTLSDYVPFYFTPLSRMAFLIKTGGNVVQRDGSEIVILVSSLPRLAADGIRFLFTDRVAQDADARFSADAGELDRIDWDILRRRDYNLDSNDPGKSRRYQAEALIHGTMPVSSLLALACHDEEQQAWVEALARSERVDCPVLTKRDWYF